MRKLTETYEKWSLKINFNKTKYLVTGGVTNDLRVDGKEIKTCCEFKYLESILTKEANSQ